MRKLIATASLLFFLAGCKEVDRNKVHAELVYGTDNLYHFCDETNTLIYFTDLDGEDDQYELIWPGGCVKTDREGQNKQQANPPENK